MEISKPLKIINLIVLVAVGLVLVMYITLLVGIEIIDNQPQGLGLSNVTDNSSPTNDPTLGSTLLALIIGGLVFWAALGVRLGKKNAILLAFTMAVIDIVFKIYQSFSEATSITGLLGFILPILYVYFLFDCIKKNRLIQI